MYYGLPLSAEELASRTKFPLEFVKTVGDELGQQLLSHPPSKSGEGIRPLGEGIRVGVYLEGKEKTMMSTAATLRRSNTPSLESSS